MRVRLPVMVDEHGRVSEVSVLDWPDEHVVAPAIAAIRAWKYKPGLKEGKAVSTETEATLVFRAR